MIKITKDLLADTAEKARQAERKRCNYNFHKDHSDPINRMLNSMVRGSYFPPHKHENPDKLEIFIILKGKVLLVEFDDEGSLADHFVLDPKKGDMGIEIPARKWHSLVPLADTSVLYEIKEGPYEKEADKKFPGWAPKEDEEGAREFVEKILKELNIQEG